MVEETITDRTSTTSSGAGVQPRRILLKLEENAGVLQGRFAKSSDAIAFRQIDSEGSRHVLTYLITGTLDGPRLRIRFPAEAGRTYEVAAAVNERMIVGSYVVNYSVNGAEKTTSGRFEIERY